MTVLFITNKQTNLALMAFKKVALKFIEWYEYLQHARSFTYFISSLSKTLQRLNFS